jgi:hypothetical protein
LCANAHHHLFSIALDESLTRKQKQLSVRENVRLDLRYSEHEIKWKNIESWGMEKAKVEAHRLEDYFQLLFFSRLSPSRVAHIA